MLIHKGFAMLLMLVWAAGTLASDLPRANPERVGVSKDRLQRINQMAQAYVDKRQYAGVVTMVARDGKIIHSNAVGQFGFDNEKPLSEDTLFRIFSMTKPITVVAALMLYEEGKFQMTDPVAKHLPEFLDQKLYTEGGLIEPSSPMTMGQLFTHTAGLTYGFTPDNPVDLMYREDYPLEAQDLTEFSTKLAKLPLRFEPGTRYHYSVATDLLGAAIERMSGVPLDRFFHERIFEPLDMEDTFFSVPEDKFHRLASSHVWDAESGQVVPVPMDQRRDYRNVTLFSGGGGLVSTVNDYMRFCEMIRRQGSFNGARLLGPKTVQYMGLNHLSAKVRAEGVGEYPSDDFFPGQSKALGFGVVTNPGLMPSTSSKGELSWGGAAGTKFWIDPEEEIVGIAMVQLYRSPWPLRFDFKVATYQALTELYDSD
ncbi:MAG: serine hydrolase domain-containing protein [Pseudomonadota bacterium]